MNSRPKQPKYARNKNILVIGGSGSGKTRFFCEAVNLMQMHIHPMSVTDPKGTVASRRCGKLFLERKGYRHKGASTLINFQEIHAIQPIGLYPQSEKDILKLVNALIANTKGRRRKSFGKISGSKRNGSFTAH